MKKNQVISTKERNNTPLTKILKNILNIHLKSIRLKEKKGLIGNMKYLPSFSKEWKNIIYSYNKNNLKNIPVNSLTINKIIQSYFNLFFKSSRFVSRRIKKSSKFLRLRKRRTLLRKIYVSDAEIKHTSDKVKITLFAVNREKKNLKKKYIKLYKKITHNLLKRYVSLYKNYILNLYFFLEEHYINRYYYYLNNNPSPQNYMKYKLNSLGIFLILNNLLLKKLWSLILVQKTKKYIRLIRKYNLLYSLNHFKLNKLVLLPKLSNILGKILGKKIDYNIINLKSITFSPDIFTNILALKIKKIKTSYIRKMLTVLNKAYLPKINTIQERTKVQTWDNLDLFLNKFKNLNIISNNSNITNILKKNFVYEENATSKKSLSTNENIHNTIYNNIKYKNMSGIQIEVKGRLTKRYRADRSIFTLKRKGGFKNIDSSFKGLSSILFRGNTKSNVSYSLANSKRRIGAFAVKGWISGK
jgi:hypothetical protein